MMSDARRLLRWLVRSRPPRAALWRATASGLVASLTSVGLFVGALTLLVVSATRPGLRAVAAALVIIEVLAFLRSPIRFSERVSAHRLGFQAVTRWRRWLVASVGRWSYRRWRAYAAGDLLERSLRDTDELQDLWLRGALPAISAVATMVVGDVVVGVLPPRGGWWTFAAALAAVQALGVVGLITNVNPAVRADRVLRQARSTYQATLVELSATAPELTLLGARDFLDRRAHEHHRALRDAEVGAERQRRVALGVAPFITVVGLGILAARHPHTSPTWIVVAALVDLATFDALSVLRGALDTGVAVSAAAERLEDLESPARPGYEPWPQDGSLDARDLQVSEGDHALVVNAAIAAAPGRRIAIVGASGTGKSTILRALADLDEPDEGTVTIGTTPVSSIAETSLRERLVYLASEPGLMRGYAGDVVRLGRRSVRDPFADLQGLGISADAGTRWTALSRGERQRVAVARALLTAPDVVLLDEPTSGLGREETDAVLRLLDDTGATLVIATHDPQVVEWCDDVLELRDGVLSPLNR